MTNSDAKALLLARGRGYLYKGRYPQVVVFTRSGVEIDKLECAFGGHHYKHNAGYVWILSRNIELVKMLAIIHPNRSQHGFEDVIISKPSRGQHEKM